VIAGLWAAADFTAAYPFVPLLAFGAFALGLVTLATTAGGRAAAAKMMSKVPVVGGILLWSSVGRFASVLRMSLATSVPLPVALERAFAAGGRVNSRVAADCVAAVRRGSPLHQELTKLRALPAKALHLVSLGERSGTLKEALALLTTEASIQVERRTALVGTLLGPLLIVLVGSLVGAVAFSIFSALMEINSFAS
jgi:type II secretory pathway component PulF